MKELTSNHDDMDKRLAIFFGLGAFLMSALVGLIRGYTLEGFLLQGVVVLVLAILAGYAFGYWLRRALAATTPAEELPENTERRARNAETLEEGSLVIPGQGAETVVAEEPGSPSGQVVNFSFPELDPMEAAAPPPAPEPSPDVAEEGDLPPPPVPAWLR
jgi:membrane protein implicated in regulation of membrane protease activity